MSERALAENGKDEKRDTPAYEPPAIVWEEEIDAKVRLATACSHVYGEGGLCDEIPGS